MQFAFVHVQVVPGNDVFYFVDGLFAAGSMHLVWIILINSSGGL